MSKLIRSKNWGRSKAGVSTALRIAKSKKKTVVSRAKAQAIKGR